MRSFTSLTIRNLTAHPLRSILTALAITLGVAMVLAAAIVGQAANRSAVALSEQGPQVDLEIFARDGDPFQENILATLRAHPDVAHASPSLRVEASGIDPPIDHLTLAGVNPEAYQSLHRPELAGGAFLNAPGTIVLPVALALKHSLNTGDKLTLAAEGREATVTVSGRLKLEQDIAALDKSNTAFIPLDTAQTLAGLPGQIDRVEIVLRPGADVERAKASLAQLLGEDLAVVRTAAAAGVMSNILLVQAGLTIVGLIILLAAGFVIMNAFAMSITARTREIGTLRALGMTRRQVIRTVLLEAGVLGLTGIVAGVLVGLGLAWGVMRLMDTLDDAPFAAPWWGLTFSALMGLTVTFASALGPARRAGRVSPLVAARPETTLAVNWYIRYGGRLGAWILALALVGVTACGFIFRPDALTAQIVMIPAQAALMGAAILLLPALIAPLTALIRPLLARRLGTAGRLAADNLARNKLRAVLTAGGLTAGLTIIIATSGLMTAGLKGSFGRLGLMLGEDSFLTGNLGALVTSGEMSVENFFQFISADEPPFDLLPVLDALAPLVDANIIEVERNRFAAIPPQVSALPGAPGLFVDPEIFLRLGNFEFFAGDAETALEWMRRGQAVLLQPIAAERLGVKVGDAIPLQTPRGEVEFTVAGIGGSGWNMPIFPYADGETYFNVTAPSHLGIVVPQGQNIEAALAQVRQAIEPFPEMTLSSDYGNPFDPLAAMVGRLELLLNALLLLAVVVAALGVVNTMVINVTERGREIGLLRAVGATQRQVRRAVVAEAATLGLLAALAAGGLSLLMLLTWGLLVLPNGTASIGVRPDWETIRLTMGAGLRDMGLASLVALIFGPLVAGLAAYYPAKRAAAVDVVTATRSEQVTLSKTKSVRPESRRKLARSLVWTLAWRSLDAHRTRAVLSAVAVGLSVTMIIATDVISGAIINILARSEDVQAAMGGLLEQLDGLLAIVGVAISGTAAFLVFNVFAMSVAQRRQQIGSLRSLGMIRRQVMALILSEALIVSGVGSALGLLLGPLVGRGMLAFLRTLGTAFSGFGDSVLPAQSALLAVALGMGMTLLATLIPAWGATRVSPLSALRQQGANGVKSPAVKPRVGALAAMPAMIAYLLLNPPGEWLLPPQSYWLAVLLSLVWLICLALVLPALINLLAKRLRAPLTRLGGAAGRLMADNLQRARRRVTLTIAGLVIGLTLVVGMTGFFAFWMDELMGVSIGRFEYEGAWGIYAFDIMGGTGAVAGLDSLQISDEATADLRAIAAGQADLAEVYFVIVPEFSFLGDSYFSFIMSPRQLKRVGSTMFSFSEGTWETAMPLMEAGCGVLTTPAVANMNGVGLGDTLIVQGKSGPVECTIAGLGTTFVGATFISSAAGESFGVKKPMAIFVSARPGSDPAQLEQDLMALQNRHSNIYAVKMTDYTHLVRQTMRLVKGMMGAILFLTIVLAALGVVNVTVISVAERRREFGLLRGVGATRRQVQTVIVGEAGLMGLVGGGLGLVAGAGITFILVMVLGGQMMGIELDLLPAAWRSLKPALLNGLTGLLAAPFIAAGAAWLPARSILRGSAIETMQPERRQQPLSPRRAAGRLWRWGSLRARFTLGTGLLMTLVLAALITVITLHARIRLQEQVHDAVRTMVAWNAGLVELNLPEEATNLTLETLTAGGGPFSFDADAMLRFRSMMDGLTEQGLVDFAIADRDNVTLVSLNVNDIGTVLPELGARDEATATSVRAEGEWLVYAAAPVRNDDGAPVGSVRLTLNARELQDFLSRLRSGLALAGGIIILLGLALSWGLTTPLVTATRQLAAHAADVGRGEFIPFRRSPRFQWLDRLSLRTKLTGAMVFILVLMVAVLQLIAIPIERRRIDTTLKRNLTAGAEWVGQAASESFDASRFNLSPTNLLTLNELLRQTQTLDMAHLQRLTEQLRSDDVAYIALIDRDGTITLSDQLELIGEGAPAPPETQIKADLWRGDDVWVVSTPLRRGRDGEQVGALRMAVRRERVETFLNESRSLFRLTGLIAVLAGVLLAQAIGGAVTAPVRQLAAGTRRVAGGDLSARFRVERHDELAILADAYNRMVVGLQEREWLRDMFGRFVSREVAEAIRAGQVRLEGENRVVSILFCDIRGFTQRSERATPAEMVALLNEYLPLVVSAAQRHEGTVNKFGGDSTLVIYGAPKPLQESAYHAVLTALDMRVNLTRLNERLAERGEAPIRIGVGINTGVALAGAVGPQERQEYTVIGDAVNLASRIEALNKDYPAHDILISGQTYAALGSRRKEFAFADLGFVQIRGKVEPVQVWAVVKRA